MGIGAGMVNVKGQAFIMMDFAEKLRHAQAGAHGDWALYISPEVNKLPFEIGRFDDPYLPYARAIYTATKDLVCAYMLDFGAYLRLGAAGAVALERSIDLIGDTHPVILDAALASTRFVGIWDETAYGCDGLTIADARVLSAYQTRADRAAFLMATGDVDSRVNPTYWVDARTLGIDTLRIRLLPDEILFKARSLNFTETLQTLVSEVIRG